MSGKGERISIIVRSINVIIKEEKEYHKGRYDIRFVILM